MTNTPNDKSEMTDEELIASVPDIPWGEKMLLPFIGYWVSVFTVVVTPLLFIIYSASVFNYISLGVVIIGGIGLIIITNKDKKTYTDAPKVCCVITSKKKKLFSIKYEVKILNGEALESNAYFSLPRTNAANKDYKSPDVGERIVVYQNIEDTKLVKPLPSQFIKKKFKYQFI